MYSEDLNFKSMIFKVLFMYLMVYFVALLFSYSLDFESLLNNIQYKYLMILNIISMSLGLPLTIIFDFMLMKYLGLSYILFFSPVLTFCGLIQVLILSKINFKFSKISLMSKNTYNNNLYKFFKKVNFKSFYILIISTFPILPFSLGSYLIASSKSKKSNMLMYSFLGSCFYYLVLFLMIGNN